jgi:glyoxylase I family protein
MQPIVHSIHCNFLPVTNLKKSVNWYANYFGFKLLWLYGDFASCCLDPDGTKLTLARVERVTPAFFLKNEKPHPFITLGTSNIHRTHESLREKGAEVQPIITFGDGHVCFTIKDPDEHLIYVSHTAVK